MNTNETQEIEIPSEWDVTVQGAERRGICIGIKASRDAILQGLLAEFYLFKKGKPVTNVYDIENVIREIVDVLLAEQEEKI